MIKISLQRSILFLLVPFFLIIFADRSFAIPTTPGTATSPDWKGDHFVSGDFTLTTTGSTDPQYPIWYYKLCRSNDANWGEWRGCEVIVGYTTGPNDKSMLITGTHRPSYNKQKWYYWVAVNTQFQETWGGGQYVHDMAQDTVAPTTPGSPVTGWTRDRYVNSDFTLTTSGSTDNESGIAGYSLCRSYESSGEWRPCETWVTYLGGTSVAISGANKPSNGKFMWYYWYAQDYKGNLSPASAGGYIRMDTQGPTYNETTFTGCSYEIGNDCWVKNGQTFYINVKHTENPAMNVGTNLQYLELSKNNANLGSWTPSTANIKSSAQPYGITQNGLYAPFQDGDNGQGPMVDNGHLDIQSAECIQTANCNVTAHGKWKVVAGNGMDTFTNGNFWTQTSNVAFNIAQGGRTTVRIGGPAWENITSTTTHTGAKRFTMDIYTNPTSASAHALALDNVAYRSGVIYWSGPNSFSVQTYSNGTWAYPFSFPLVVTRNAWYTVDISYNGDGTTTTCIYLSGGVADPANCYTTGSIFPTNWSYQIKAWNDVNYMYLSNFKSDENYGATVYMYDGLWQGVGYTQTGKWVKTDTFLPVHKSVTLSNNNWRVNNNSTYDITIKVKDSESGMSIGHAAIAALINFQGGNSANPRGYFVWHNSAQANELDKITCTGGGFAWKYNSFNPSSITLVACATSVSGNERTLTLTVRPNATFGEFASMNDISVSAGDGAGNSSAWQNFDLNFSSYKVVESASCNFDPANAQNKVNGLLYAWNQTCGAAFGTYLTDVGLTMDTTITALKSSPANLQSVAASLAVPHQALVAESSLKAQGLLQSALKQKIQTYLCDSKFNSFYNKPQILTHYGLNGAPFNITTPPTCS